MRLNKRFRLWLLFKGAGYGIRKRCIALVARHSAADHHPVGFVLALSDL
jgi:hypothetical protein